MTTLELHNGDCLEVMKHLPAGSIDLFLCDLPYGCLTNNPKKDGTEGQSKGGLMYSASSGCAWDIKLDLDLFWEQVKRLRRNDAVPCIMFCTTKFGNELINSNPKEFRYDLVWDKGRGVSFLSANKMPMRSHEMIYVFSKAGAYYNRVDLKGEFENTNKGSRPKIFHTCQPFGYTEKESNEGKRCVKSVIEIANKKTKGGHPTQKPKELYKWLIERYCPPDGTVLDPTFGSGNSVFTAFELGRSAIGIEKDEKFYKKAVERQGGT
jgi:site-specific DNA-methyltransferase (adenine-specific)